MMGDNDFPMTLAGSGGSPYQPYVPPVGPANPTQPSEGFDEFRRKHGLPAKDPKGFAKGYAYQLGEYEQAGTEVPPLRIQDEALKAFGAPLQANMSVSGEPTFETLLAGSPSFDLRYPKMPGIGTENQSIEGLPNASPELIRKFVERKLKNLGGQELPGFLKGA